MSSELPAIVDPQVVTPLGGGDVLVIADSPGQMQTAQGALIAWAGHKLAQVKLELAEAEATYDQAVGCGVRMGGVNKLLNSARRAISYYEKVKAALEDGYCIVPDFPVDIVAIRTEVDAEPDGKMRETNGWRPDAPHDPQLLDVGEGQYVDPNARVAKIGERKTYNGKGEQTGTMTQWMPTEFRDVGLPVKFMKPRVLEATNQALAGKIFDEIGILPARPKKDPLIIGRIIDPKGRRLSFLISWFVDSRDL